MDQNCYICFIDLIGTKNLALEDSFNYLNSLKQFQYVLIEQSLLFEENQAELYFFSDCAYIECQDIENLINYISNVRNELFPHGYYFKAAITNGKLNALTGKEDNSYIQNKYSNDPEFIRSYEDIKAKLDKSAIKINGTIFFGTHISKAFLMQENLKGLATYIDREIIDQNLLNTNLLVKSLHLPNPLSKKPEVFYDIKFDDDELTESYFKYLIQKYSSANLRQKKYGRYFLSLIATWIGSENFNNVSYNQKKDDIDNAPYTLKEMLSLNTKYKEMFENAIGIEYLYYLLLDKIYTDQNGHNAATKVILRTIIKFKKIANGIIKDFDLISHDIIRKANRAHLFADYEKILSDRK